MVDFWRWCRLGDVSELVKETINPATLGDQFVYYYSIPAYDSGNPETTPASAIRSNKLRIRPDNILVSRINPHIPRTWWARSDEKRPALASTEFIPLKAKAGVDSGFLFQVCRSPDFFQAMTAMVTGTTGSHQRVDLSELLHIRLYLPPLSEQRAIAEVLGALDDKIEANRRVQGAAEALARMLVAEAQAGADLRLPIGAFVDRIAEIVQPVDIPMGTTYIALEHMSRGSLIIKEFGTSDVVMSAKATFRVKDILFGRLRPYFKKVAIAPRDGVCSTDILVLRTKSDDWALVSVVCASDEVIDYATAGSEGTRMPRVSWDYLARFEVPMPDPETRMALQAKVAPLLELGMTLSLESMRLVALRDTLLPKLLSGELRVRDAESLVEEAV